MTVIYLILVYNLYMVLWGRTHTCAYGYMPMCISHDQHRPTTTSVQHVTTTTLYTGHSHTATTTTTPAAAVPTRSRRSRQPL